MSLGLETSRDSIFEVLVLVSVLKLRVLVLVLVLKGQCLGLGLGHLSVDLGVCADKASAKTTHEKLSLRTVVMVYLGFVTTHHAPNADLWAEVAKIDAFKSVLPLFEKIFPACNVSTSLTHIQSQRVADAPQQSQDGGQAFVAVSFFKMQQQTVNVCHCMNFMTVFVFILCLL